MSAPVSCAVVAWAAQSALGEGEAALGVGVLGEPAKGAVSRDDELVAAGLLRPFCARATGLGDSREAEPVDRATLLLDRVLAGCAAELDRALPDWRNKRVGLALGTSSGGMRAFARRFGKDAVRSPEGALEATYLGPLTMVARPCDLEPVVYVLGACASSTFAIGLARAWIHAGRCDIALAGGFDAVSVFVAAGFEALRATCTESGPRPFRVGRDGLALGEGAALVALTSEETAAASRVPVLGWVSGFGATCDAVHLTAPDREGRGLARAARSAIDDAGGVAIDLVSAHGTATVFNDASESTAIATALRDRAANVPTFALKGGIGHTLGAAGALETLSALVAMNGSIAPASVGGGTIDGGASGVRVLDRAERHEAKAALKLSAAFGGANGALVLTRAAVPASARPPTAARPVFVSRAVAITSGIEAACAPSALAAATGYAEDKIARADLLVRLTMAAVAKLRDEGLRAYAGAPGVVLAGAGILVGVGLATIDTNAQFLARLDTAGASRGEPRRFPYTTPNAPAGEVAVAFGLTGPAFAVGGGPHGGLEALGAAAELVRAGVAERIVVVGVDEGGAASARIAADTKPGAVALLVASELERDPRRPRGQWARLEGWKAGLAREGALGVSLPRAVEAHRALLPLAEGAPEALDVATAWGGFANARFFWL